MFRHPKYYKELRKLRNKSDQAISEATGTPTRQSVRPGPGLKLQAREDSTAKRVAEPQASSAKLLEERATSIKRQAQRLKRQAKRFKRHDPGPWKKFHGPLTEVLY